MYVCTYVTYTLYSTCKQYTYLGSSLGCRGLWLGLFEAGAAGWSAGPGQVSAGWWRPQCASPQQEQPSDRHCPPSGPHRLLAR